jgi:hypothetical protein
VEASTEKIVIKRKDISNKIRKIRKIISKTAERNPQSTSKEASIGNQANSKYMPMKPQ